MTSHPNRSKRPDAAGANPSPEEIRAARDALGLTLKAAGAIVYCSLRAWQDWESGERRMHPATWDLFRIRATDPDGTALALRRAIRSIDGRISRRERDQPTNGR